MNGNIILNCIMNNNILNSLSTNPILLMQDLRPAQYLKYNNIVMAWIQDNGELSLSGEWLTQTGLTGQPLAISVMAGKVIIQFQKMNMLL